MSYSLQFRRQVFEFKAKKGLTFEQTSQHFDIGIRTLFRWQKCIEPCTTRNKPATKIDMAALLEDVEKNPDDYQYERAARFGVTQGAIGFALKRLNISRKKTLKHPKANEDLRTAFKKRIEAHQSKGRAILYLDESGLCHAPTVIQ